MASWGWAFVAVLVYNLCWLIGYRVGFRDGNEETLIKLRKAGYL